MKNKKILISLLGFVCIFLVSVISPRVLFPSDILFYFPGFSSDGWVRPHNSLLADPVFQFEPWRQYAKERLQKGEFPLWNDLNAKGVPFFANMQSAVLFPLSVLSYVLPTHISLTMLPLMKLYLLFLFSFFYLKSLKCSTSVSVIGASSIAFSAFSITWLLWPQTNVFFFLPLFLLCTEKIRKKGKKQYCWYLLLSFGYFFAILGGHPETLQQVFIVHILYTLFRFWKTPKVILKVFFSIIVGFFLGAVQLIPFLEYLFQSFSYNERVVNPLSSYLPLQSFILNIIPFLFGAPHLEFYKAIGDSNFQEEIGGYTGIIILLSTFLAYFKLRKVTIISFWFYLSITIWLIVYNIWPFSLILNLPILNLGANSRFIAFSAFGFCIVFSIFLEKLRTKMIMLSTTFISIFCALNLGALLILLASFFINPERYIIHDEKIILLIQFLKGHIAYILTTTLLFVGIYMILKKRNLLTTSYFYLLIIPLLLQNIGLFWNYNPLTSMSIYYPKTRLSESLKNLQQGSVLEIGNLNIPPDINIKYNLLQAENYDALDLNSYKNAFLKEFSFRNHWDKIADVRKDSLQTFGIKYIISDFNINLLRLKVQKQAEKILPPIDKKGIIISFPSQSGRLSQIRLLTANYNRLNTCKVTLKIIDKTTGKIRQTSFLCKDVRDKMFYTLDMKELSLRKQDQYMMHIYSNDSLAKNAISLWGNSRGVPYLELLINRDKADDYQLVMHENNVNIWKAPGVSEVVFEGSYRIVTKKAEQLVLTTSNRNSAWIEIKQSYFSGWIAKVDGIKTEIKHSGPFIKVYIPKGKHVFLLEYQPISFKFGLFVSIITFFSCLLFIVKKNYTIE